MKREQIKIEDEQRSVKKEVWDRTKIIEENLMKIKQEEIEKILEKNYQMKAPANNGMSIKWLTHKF